MAEMNRRGFIGALVGGVAIAQAVRSWPFRVFSFPSELQILSIVGQTMFTTSAAGKNYFEAGDTIWIVHPDQAEAMEELMYRGKYRVTSVNRVENSITIDAIPRKIFLSESI